LICLCSKNQEEDVFAVFDKHPDMVLKRHHLVNWRIKWQSKSENLKRLAEELQLGLNSFIFIDDNPVECAEVRANCPEVLTLQLPQECETQSYQPSAVRIPQFLEHIWAFDQLQTTQEDQQRRNFYQQNVQRQRLQQNSLSFTDFLAQLNLEIEISPMQPEQLSRVAQLTQRTNQFNLTTIRRSEVEIQQLSNLGGLECHVVQVKDRFGDYGLVGLLLFEAQEKALVVDTFLLSCRVLGRGVEHRMLASLGTLAQTRGLGRVEVCYTPTEKNQPAWDFLISVGEQFRQRNNEGWIFNFPSQTASECNLIFISDRAVVANNSNQDANDTSDRSGKIASPTDFFERIARNLYSPELILKEITSRRQRKRPELEIEFVAPRTPIEKAIANLFAEILNLDKVGINDNFFELGGDSIRGAILINKLQAQLTEIVHFVVLFDTQTVARLAAYIQEHYPQALAKLLGEEITLTRDFSQERIDETKVMQMRSLIPSLAPPIDDDRSKNPPAIFILSPYRSGSTLLRVIMGGHPQLFAPPELELLLTDGIYAQSRMVGDVKFHEHQGINASTAESWKQYYTIDFLSDGAWQVAESLGYEKSGSAKTLTTNAAIPVNRDNQRVSQTFPLSDIVVGSPIAGRHQSQIEGLIGFFVNTLVLRTRFQDNPTFRELLTQVRRVALEAYAHQDLPFEKLVEELQPDRSLSHTPLFQVWLNMLNLGENQLQLSGLTVEQLPISSPVSKFDLTLYVREKHEELKLEWVYNRDLFNPETIAWMSLHFQTLLEAIITNPGQALLQADCPYSPTTMSRCCKKNSPLIRTRCTCDRCNFGSVKGR
jgi:FkbH-like protein